MEQAEAIVLQDAADRVDELAPSLGCESRLILGRPDDVLLAASKNADLLVLGCSGRSTSWLGRMLTNVPAHASCPVVAVPEGATAPRGEVVVGIDGEGVCAEAVGYAFDQAARWNVGLIAVMALAAGFDGYVPSEGLLEQLHQKGRRHLAEALSGWCGSYPDVAVTQLVALGDALPALTEAAKDARLLVIGTHRRGALRALALGSVGSSLLRAAPCPIAIVGTHAPDKPTARREHRAEQLIGTSQSGL